MCLAVPGELLSLSGKTPETRTGEIDFGGVRRSVNMAYLPDANPGDHVMVHVGFGIAVVDEAEAQRLWDLLEEIGETGFD